VVMPILALMTMGKMVKNLGQKQSQDAEDRAYTLEKRDRERAQWKRDDALQTSMDGAAKPVKVEDGSSYQPANDDEGNPMPANPTAGMLAVGGKKFTDPAQANAAAASMNAPTAVVRRQAAAMQAAGKPIEAQHYEQIARKMEEEGILHFIDANHKRVPSVEDIRAGKNVEFDLDAVPEFNAAGGDRIPDGAKGRAKILKLPSGQEIADFEVVGPDGKPIAPSARRIEAMYGYSRAERDRMDRDGYKQGIDIAHQGTMEKIAQQNADSSQSLRAAQADAATARAEAAATRAAAASKPAAAQTPESTFDAKAATALAADLVKKESEAAAQNGKTMTGPQVAARVQEVVGAMLQQHTNAFITGTVTRELTASQADPATYAATYAKASKLIPAAQLGKLGFAPPGGAKPAAATAQTKTSAPAPAPAPAAPSMFDRAAQAVQPALQRMAPVVQRMSDLGTDYSSPQGKQMLAARVQEAQNGGAPLSEVETLRAQQAGLI
jgi:hypothetical protein